MLVLFCGALMAQETEGTKTEGEKTVSEKTETPKAEPPKQEEAQPKPETPIEEKEGTLFGILKLNIAWCGIAKFDYYSSDNTVSILQDGAVVYDKVSVHDTFSMRAAYLYATGSVGDLKGSLLLNFVNKDSNPVCWWYIEFPPFSELKEYLKVRAGQFIKPFGRQPQTFPYELTFARYGQILGRLFDNGAGFYDAGVSFLGSKTFELAKIDFNFKYELGIFNGEKMNTSDTTDQKAICGRVEFASKKITSWVKADMLSFGFSYFNGGPRFMNDAYNTKFTERTYFGADLEFRCMQKRLSILFEYASGTDDLSYIDSVTHIPMVELNRPTDGWFVELGYFVYVNKKLASENAPLPELRKRPFGLQIAALLDVLNLASNPKMYVATGEYQRPMNIYGLAINYDIRWNLKLQVVFTRLDYGRYYSGLYSGVDDFSKNRITVQLGFIAF